MIQNPFFAQLRQEFQNDPYRDRFLAELQDHAEDLAEDENLPLKSLNLNFMQKHFGEPKQVKKDFNAILRPWEKLFFIFEGLFFGLIMLPISIIGLDMLKMMTGYGERYQITFLLLIILAVLWFFIYFFAFRRYRQFQVDFRFSRLRWVALITAPTLIHLLLFALDLASPTFNFYPSATGLLSSKGLSTAIVLFLLAHGLSGLLAWCAQIFNSTNKKKFPRKWISVLKKIGFVYVLLFLLIRTTGTYFEFSPLNFQNPFAVAISFPFTPLLFLEYLFWFFLSAVSGNQVQANLFLGVYFGAVLLLFLGIQSFVYLTIKKTWRSGRLLVLLYVASLFLISPKSSELHPNYQVPHLSLSSRVEKHQVSIFYPVMKYFNQDEGNFFHYKIQYNPSLASDFYFSNNTGGLFYVHPDAFFKGDYSDLFLGKQKMQEAIANGKNLNQNNPENIKKLMNRQLELRSQLFCDQRGDRSDFNSRNDWYTCDHLSFKDTVLSYHLDIQDLVFSEDGNWLLLLVTKGTYNPEEVHLLDLRNINSNS